MHEVVLSGPGKNALSTRVMQTALASLEAAGGEPVLLRGEGDAFCSGLDLKELAGLDAQGRASYLDLLDELVLKLFLHPAPTVACMNGHAIAGGAVMALTCDLRLLTSRPRTRVGLNEVAIGLEFPPRVLKLARARLGPRNERRVLLEGGLYDPSQALALGLVDELCDDVIVAARAAVLGLARHDAEVYAQTKRQLTEGVLDLCQADIARYRDNILPRWQSPELGARLLKILGR